MTTSSIGKPVYIKTKEEREILDKILNPVPKPRLTIEIYREIVQKANQNIELLNEEYQQLLIELHNIEQDPKIKHYLGLLNNYSQIRDEINSKRCENNQKIEEALKHYECPHPLYAASGNTAKCVICQKAHKYNGWAIEKPDKWQKLIDDKKLIAKVTSYWDWRDHYTFYVPEETVPFDDVVNLYYLLNEKKEKLTRCRIIDESHSIEDLVWQYYTKKEKTKCKTKK